MLTKSKLSHIMLIKIKYNQHIRITIPVFLGVIDELIADFKDLAWIFDRLFPSWNQKVLKWKSDYIAKHMPIENFSLELIFKLIQELFYEIRKHKRWKLVEIDAKGVYLKMEFL
ncbi:hypothetical protein SAMN05446037_103048 [Anaerovirgula multivorans]|uniref:Uncharacterized protein n=1 Tax=Anaerovirgula multivorans TaxID=312168 RepID=A0A239ITP6_9FIRM|nr:hypothetical protein [Anaerovirgula multivorans]SNS96961.1 hypothetical protein SAMN05446037_103048 [Anaerovirgula multivorans]